MKITLITPCFNAEASLAATMRSILQQEALADGSVELQYLICDGGSRDGTVRIAESFKHPAVRVLSEPDRGMYDALAKGMQRAEGEVIGYLNAGDLLHPTAFGLLAEIFSARPEVRWLSAMHTLLNERHQVTAARLPFKYRRRLLRAGLYGRFLPFVQQESTFWRRELLAGVDYGRLAGLRLAGDHYLWSRFARDSEPFIIATILGCFTIHEGQLSQNRAAYYAEMRSVSDTPMPWDLALAALDLPLWRMPDKIKKLLNHKHLLRYHHGRHQWS